MEPFGGRDPRFAWVELAYGAHRRRLALPRLSRPVLVVGPNGAGKTTLLESLTRVLFGFNRRSAEERELLQARRPWTGDAFRATVAVETGGDVLLIERDFETDGVSVRLADGGRPLFEGEAKPGEARESHRRYRELLARRFGLDELGPYERTACVRQGALVRDTRIGEELLRIAAGGHAAVDAAREAVLVRHYRLTRESIGDGTPGKRSAREREELLEQVAAERAALAEARAAEERRRPLVEEAGAACLQLEGLEAEIRALEAAIGPLAERRALRADRAAAADRLARVEERGEELAAGLAAWEGARRAVGEALGEGAYPADFETRAGALGVLWGERARLAAAARAAAREAEAPFPAWAPAAIAGGALVCLAAFAAWAVTGIGVAMAFLVPGILAALGGWIAVEQVRARRRQADARRDALEAETKGKSGAIAGHLEGVPEAVTLTPDTLSDRLRRFRRQEAARREAERCGRELEAAIARSRAALREVRARRGEAPPNAQAPHGAAGGAHAPGAADATAALEREATELRLALEEERRRASAEAARLDVRLEGADLAPGDLPDGVAAEARAVEAALETRRARRARAAERLRELEVEVATRGRAAVSPVAIERRIAELEERLREVEESVRAHRHAWRLLGDAYEEFRATDQERLLACISAQLALLAGGALGPLESEDGLERCALRAFGRSVPIASPPLSYGELHAVLLAVRLGAVDFLAGSGIHLPLLVDEPFAHLDPARAAEVWRLLCRVARERQVIVTTQDTLLLRRLRVEPDVVLPEPVQGELDLGPAAARPEGGQEKAREERPGDGRPPASGGFSPDP